MKIHDNRHETDKKKKNWLGAYISKQQVFKYNEGVSSRQSIQYHLQPCELMRRGVDYA